jgi:ferredoxin
MKLHIDWTACDGRGLCTELVPELLDRDDWGYPVPRERPEPGVPASLRSAARRAVTQCPRLALQLLTDDGRVAEAHPTRRRKMSDRMPSRLARNRKAR